MSTFCRLLWPVAPCPPSLVRGPPQCLLPPPAPPTKPPAQGSCPGCCAPLLLAPATLPGPGPGSWTGSGCGGPPVCREQLCSAALQCSWPALGCLSCQMGKRCQEAQHHQNIWCTYIALFGARRMGGWHVVHAIAGHNANCCNACKLPGDYAGARHQEIVLSCLLTVCCGAHDAPALQHVMQQWQKCCCRYQPHKAVGVHSPGS